VPFPVVAYAGMIVDRGTKRRPKPPLLICYGGLCWRFRNVGADRERCDIWLDVVDAKLLKSATAALGLVRWARRMLRTAAQLGEPAVYCIRDDLPGSARLLSIVGLDRVAEGVPFYLEDGTERTGDAYRWNSPHSPPSPLSVPPS